MNAHYFSPFVLGCGMNGYRWLALLLLLLSTQSLCAQIRFNSYGLKNGERLNAEPVRGASKTIAEWEAEAKKSLAEDNRQAAEKALSFIAKRKDLSKKDREHLRSIATKFATSEGNEKAGLRAMGALMLVDVGDKESVKVLVDLFEDGSTSVQLAAIRASRVLHDDTTVAALASYAKKHQPTDEFHLESDPVAVLEKIGTKAAKDALHDIYKTCPARSDAAARAIDALNKKKR